ncbi:dTMP kinase [Paenibacillus glucanolyticus]|uniref:dTMP kinase n=1 Tax=Paenibacillus glucanolyticus TaxID=59843 RepID=UPI0034CD2C7F
MRGLLIAICGLDGAGKTTQIELLNKWLLEYKETVLLTKQPTDAYRNDLRVRSYLDKGECADMRIIALLSAADRLHHMKTEIEPALNRGIHVVSDRYLYSSFAFFINRGLSFDYLKSLYQDIREPDLTFFLDIDPTVTLNRVKMRDGVENLKYEESDSTFFKGVRSTFLTVLPQNAITINSSQPINDVHFQIVTKVQSVLDEKVVNQ